MYYSRGNSRNNNRYRGRRWLGGKSRRAQNRGSSRGNYSQNAYNPETGRPYVCFNCNSEDHFARDCPEPPRKKKTYPSFFSEGESSRANVNQEEEVHINLSEMADSLSL